MRVKTIAHRNAGPAFLSAGREKLDRLFPGLFEHIEAGPPDVIFFLSGGSEQEAIAGLVPERFTLLLAGFEDNAYAAAMEVAAWAAHRQVPVRLMSLDEARDCRFPEMLDSVCQALRRLKGQRAGLIGDVSHWLVASSVQKDRANEKLGLEIVHLPWHALPDYDSFLPDQELYDAFRDHPREGLTREAGILGFLKHVRDIHKLDALTLECFNMVTERSVTACLALAVLNARGVPAGCEGDLVSLAGMMLARELTGRVPWMANVAAIRGGRVLFAHCTAPLNLVERVRIDTHFETGKSAAIQGQTIFDEVTVFRLNETLDKAFIAKGRVVSRPRHDFACRTQSEVEMDLSDDRKLRDHPLGNHHLLLPGDQRDLLELCCQYTGIRLV